MNDGMKNGKWVFAPRNFYFGDYILSAPGYKCSVCGKWFQGTALSSKCENCGSENKEYKEAENGKENRPQRS